jgi:hypothetical protein
MLFREKKFCVSATKLLNFLSFLIIKILGMYISVIFLTSYSEMSVFKCSYVNTCIALL